MSIAKSAKMSIAKKYAKPETLKRYAKSATLKRNSIVLIVISNQNSDARNAPIVKTSVPHAMRSKPARSDDGIA